MNSTVTSSPVKNLIRQIDPKAIAALIEGEWIVFASNEKAAIALCNHRYIFTLRKVPFTVQYTAESGEPKTAISHGSYDNTYEASERVSTMLPQKHLLNGYSSPWLSENWGKFGLMAKTEFLYRVDQGGIDHGLPCVALKYWSHPDQLNKSVSEYLGSSLMSIWDVVSKPRERAIACVAGDPIGTREHFHYSAVWKGRKFEFECSAIRVSESECLVLIDDVGQAQKQFWMDYRP